MVELLSLLLPIVLSAIGVFIISSAIHMATPWHKNDYLKIPDEEKIMNALRPLGIPPGDYMIPSASDMKEMRTVEFIDKMKKGPVMVVTILPSGPVSMGKNLLLWFLYSLVVSVLAAYITGRALDTGAGYLQVFRFAGTTAFIGYSLAIWQMSIWYGRSWGITFKTTVDGLIYGLFTAGIFGWLWPR